MASLNWTRRLRRLARVLPIGALVLGSRVQPARALELTKALAGLVPQGAPFGRPAHARRLLLRASTASGEDGERRPPGEARQHGERHVDQQEGEAPLELPADESGSDADEQAPEEAYSPAGAPAREPRGERADENTSEYGNELGQRGRLRGGLGRGRQRRELPDPQGDVKVGRPIPRVTP